VPRALERTRSGTGIRAGVFLLSALVAPALLDVAPPEFAWYKLTETSGSVAHDSTANGYDVSIAQRHLASSASKGGASGKGRVPKQGFRHSSAFWRSSRRRTPASRYARIYRGR
jgi:hypothetical protein